MWSPEQKCCVYSVFSRKELSVFLRTAVCFLKFRSEYSALRYIGVKSLSTCCPFPEQPASPSYLLSQSPAPPPAVRITVEEEPPTPIPPWCRCLGLGTPRPPQGPAQSLVPLCSGASLPLVPGASS